MTSVERDNSNLEVVACDLCGSAERTLFFVENGFSLVRCSRCGLLYVSPRPAAGAVFEKFSHDYISYVDSYLSSRDIYEREAAARLDLLARFSGPGRVLDVGCAVGTFLEAAKKRGWETAGVEPDEKLARYAIDNLKLDVKICDFGENGYPDGFFDAVTAHNILSHVRSPGRFFREAGRLLKPGGCLVLHTGNGAELSSRRQGEFLGEHWGTPDHLYHFSQKHLETYFAESGFTVEHVERIPLIRLLFDRENLLTFKGSKLKSVLKRLLVLLPPLRWTAMALVTAWAKARGRSGICKFAFVARKKPLNAPAGPDRPGAPL